MPITEHEPGGFRDRCSRCGGWISLGHAAGSNCQDDHPALKWELSDDAKARIAEIERHTVLSPRFR